MSGRLCTYDEIRVLHLEPSARCQAACPMCGRNLSGGRTRKNLNKGKQMVTKFLGEHVAGH